MNNDLHEWVNSLNGKPIDEFFNDIKEKYGIETTEELEKLVMAMLERFFK